MLLRATARFAADSKYEIVEPAHMELAEPSIATAFDRCVERGAKRVIVFPYFLSPGVHVREDLIEARDKLRGEFPHVAFDLAEPLGRHPLLIEIVRQRINETQG